MKANLFYNEKYSTYISEIPYFAVQAEGEAELKEKLISRAVSFLNVFQLDLKISLDSVEWQKKRAIKKDADILAAVADEVKETADKKSYKNMSSVYVQTLFSFKCMVDGAVEDTTPYYIEAIKEIGKFIKVEGGFMESGFTALARCDEMPISEGYKTLFILNSLLVDLASDIYSRFNLKGINCDNQFKFE